MKKLRFSRFVHFWEKNGVIAIFHRISRKVLFVDRDILSDIKEYLLAGLDEVSEEIKGLINCLENFRMLIPVDEQEEFEIDNLKKSILFRPCIDTLYLILTDDCNFCCTYCFFEGSYKKSETKKQSMSSDTAITSIRKFADYLKRSFEFPDFFPQEPGIVIYGGEPLLNLKVFRLAIEEVSRLKNCGELPDKLSVNINTNGSLITPEIATFCVSHNIEVDVSLDGYESVNDICRQWKKDRKGTFSDIIRAISILKKAGANVCISCTVSEANVDELPKVFEWFLDELGVDKVGFNPLLDSYHYRVKDDNYPYKVAQSMIECFKIARQRGIYEARMMRKVRAFVENQVYDRDCCGCGKQIVVSPDGKFGVCHAYSGTGEFFVQPDDNFNPFIHPFWQEWSRRSPINMPQCYDCEALTICGGGCPHNAHLKRGSIWEVDDYFCIHAKETIKWLVWDLYEQTKS